jgi:NAD(P) transhydrogenase subunit alpha
VRVAVVREVSPGERRVALVPDTVTRLSRAGHLVAAEAGAGESAYYPDADYLAAGAEVVADRERLIAEADLVASVQALPEKEAGLVASGAATVSFLQPWRQGETVTALARAGVTSFSLDLVPRVTRAQSMDALSSQALVAGYRAVLVAAELAPRMFPLFMTAAGTVPPAKVLVLGAGVAGLQAIATARRLGAVVSAFDVRSASRDEVASLGATFLELELETQEGVGGYARVQSDDFLARQRDLIGTHVRSADVVVTTAAVPGRPAPRLVTGEMVGAMRSGSVIVDLAADGGGNCELTVPGETVDVAGVRIAGLVNPASAIPLHASALFARNVFSLIELVSRDGVVDPDWTDEIVAGCWVTREGRTRPS